MNWIRKAIFARSSTVVRTILVVFLLALAGAAFSAAFQAYKKTMEAKLSVIAALAGERILLPLRQGDRQAIAEGLEEIAAAHAIDGLKLYSIEGRVIAGHGLDSGKSLSSLRLGEHLVAGWPFLLMTQYSRILYLEDRPVGLLLLYERLHVGLLAAALLVFLLVLTAVLLVWRRSLRPDSGRGRERGQRLPVPEQQEGEPLQRRLRERIAELERQRDKALLSARAKGEYLANMSHEIRTSMNGVIGVLSLLEKSGFTGEKKRLLNAAARSADSLLLVINDILDFSKIESGRMEFENITFDLREVVEECIALYIDSAASKDIRLHCYMPLDIAPLILGDPTRLRQVLTNLLGNAIKFTDQGEVSLRVSLQEENRGEQRLHFTVEDTGIGIAADRLDQLFDMFTQAGTDTTRKYGGTGLGLNLCRRLIELQGGEIGVRSSLGRGSAFWFRLTFATVERFPNAALFEKMRRRRVVLFDNCETCTTVMSQYLRCARVTSRTARNGRAVLDQLAEIGAGGQAPDFLLVDWKIIVMEIDQFISGILALFGDAAPKLYVLSRQGGLEDTLKRKGISGVIYKPLRLFQIYEELCEEDFAGGEQAGKEQAEKLEGHVLLVDDEQVNRHVGEMILKRLGLTVDSAVSGPEALAKVHERSYDLILMDVQMAGMDGIKATELIRAAEQEGSEKARTIIAMTANALPAVKERCLEAGMDGFLTKPIKPEVLLQYLQPYLSGPRQAHSAPRRGTPAEVFPSAGSRKITEEQQGGAEGSGGAAGEPVWDRALALEYLGGDEKLLEELIELFLERKERLLGALEDSMQTRDGMVISGAAHAFKGAVNHFAAAKCRNLALTIEDRAGQGLLDDLAADLVKLRREADLLVEQLERQRD